jgi:hypothetical protein
MLVDSMAVQREPDPRLIRKLTPEDVWGLLDPEEPLEGDNRRSASAIQFPYGDLNDAVEVARAMYLNAGGSGGSWEQLASWLGYGSTSSGAFRNKVATARIFGLTETKSGGATLTTLGLRIVDPSKERAARATAFLNVPLYRRIYDDHLGMTLPPDSGLEQEMVTLGVSPKQKVRARQIFQRSADQAGFFGLGRNKLVMPRTDLPALAAAASTLPSGDTPQNGTVTGLHPLIVGLLHTLPEPGSAWSQDRRRHWLDTADHVFGLLYREE